MKKLNSVRAFIFSGTLLLQLTTVLFQSRGGAGDVDLSFDPGTGVNGPVNTVLLQSDGRFVIGGQFTTVRGLSRTNLARLNADGSGDATFDPTNVFDVVDCLALQPDGKLLVGGSFNRNGILRLNANGSLDPSFHSGTGANGGVASVPPQSDGKVVINGYFTAVNGTMFDRVDGTHDRRASARLSIAT